MIDRREVPVDVEHARVLLDGPRSETATALCDRLENESSKEEGVSGANPRPSGRKSGRAASYQPPAAGKTRPEADSEIKMPNGAAHSVQPGPGW